MQHWNKGAADRTGIENLRALILSLTHSDQSHSENIFTGQNGQFFALCICRGLIELMINFNNCNSGGDICITNGLSCVYSTEEQKHHKPIEPPTHTHAYTHTSLQHHRTNERPASHFSYERYTPSQTKHLYYSTV